MIAMKKMIYTMFTMGLIYVVMELIIISLKKITYQDKVYLTLGITMLIVSGILYLYKKKTRG